MRTLKLYLEAESLSHWELHETLCRNISLICSIYIYFLSVAVEAITHGGFPGRLSPKSEHSYLHILSLLTTSNASASERLSLLELTLCASTSGSLPMDSPLSLHLPY